MVFKHLTQSYLSLHKDFYAHPAFIGNKNETKHVFDLIFGWKDCTLDREGAVREISVTSSSGTMY